MHWDNLIGMNTDLLGDAYYYGTHFFLPVFSLA